MHTYMRTQQILPTAYIKHDPLRSRLNFNHHRRRRRRRSTRGGAGRARSSSGGFGGPGARGAALPAALRGGRRGLGGVQVGAPRLL
jgi:hypothetical protein